MVERRFLTRKVVDEALSPAQGERWIADTKQKGFGLRLWATKSGGQKAFAVRTIDKRGRSVRRTFDLRSNLTYRANAGTDHSVLTLGDFLEDARKWARDEIDRLKGRLTLREENSIQRRQFGETINALRFGRAAECIISGMRSRGHNQAYVDRLDKLFARFVPAEVQQTPLCRVSPEKVADFLVDVEISPSNIRALRSFIGHIFVEASVFDGRLRSFQNRLQEHFWKKWEDKYDVRFPELRSLTSADYKLIFRILDSQGTFWQQALCIRLYFEFGAPLTRLMAAEWKQIHDGFWYPYGPSQRRYWYWRREFIDAAAQAILMRARSLVEAQFGNTRYWFPSNSPRQVRHIRSVDTVWRNTLHEVGSRYYPLREFALSYRPLQNISGIESLVRIYDPTVRSTVNVAELSKILR